LLSVAGSTPPTIGILALQGDVAEHHAVLASLGARVTQVRLPEHLEGLDGLVLPGGESSVMDKLMRIFGLREPLREAIAGGLPVLGTCAGLILLAHDIEGGIRGQETLGGLDISVRRNAFGPQVESYEAEISLSGLDGPPLKVAFIRAPVVTRVGKGVEIIATLAGGEVVGVATATLLGVAFHPEVVGEYRLHQRFLDQVLAAKRSHGEALVV
jgi:5'-phosphate synthase pdxT subunit